MPRLNQREKENLGLADGVVGEEMEEVEVTSIVLETDIEGLCRSDLLDEKENFRGMFCWVRRDG